MSNATVPVQAADGSTREIDNEQLTISGKAVHRQRVQLGSRSDTAFAVAADLVNGDWRQVVSFTPTVPVTVLGFNADGPATLSYRYRLRVGGVEKWRERIASSDNSWQAVEVSVPAATAIVVEIFHDEVTNQSFAAGINYRE